MQGEEWRAVVGYEGYYEVSNMGNVRSLPRQTGKYGFNGCWLRPSINEGGYRQVTLSVDGISKTITVHRLVAMAFVPNPDGKPQVNHIDENKLNNNAENLEWVTLHENVLHSAKGEGSRKGKAVAKMNINGAGPLEVYKSITAAAVSNGTTKGAICAVLHGRQHTAGGFRWIYEEDLYE